MARKAAAQIDEKATPPEPAPVLNEDIEVLLEPEGEATPAGEQAQAEPALQQETQPAPVSTEDAEKVSLRQRLVEVERAEQLARDQLAQAQREQQQSKGQVHQAQYDSVLNTLGAAQAQLEAAKTQLRTAQRQVREGNTELEDQIPELIEAVSGANWEVKRWETSKQQWDNWFEQQKRQPQQPQQPQRPQPQQQQPTFDEAISAAQISERAKAWLRAHPDYWNDPAKNARLQKADAAAQLLTNDENRTTDAYFTRMEELLGLKQSAGNGSAQGMEQPKSAQRQSAPASAPPTREAPSMATGRAPQPTKVTLSAEEREIAAQISASRKIPQAEAEREYAKQKLRLIRDKSDGKIS